MGTIAHKWKKQRRLNFFRDIIQESPFSHVIMGTTDTEEFRQECDDRETQRANADLLREKIKHHVTIIKGIRHLKKVKQGKV